MKIVPQVFIEDTSIQKWLVDGLNAVVYKEATQVNSNNDRYVATHALTIVLSGKLQVTTDEGQTTVVPSNHMVFLPKGLYMISDIIPTNDRFRAIVLFFEDQLIDTFLRETSANHSIACAGKEPKTFEYSTLVQLFFQGLEQMYAKTTQNHTKITQLKLQEFLHLMAVSEEGPHFLGVLNALKQKNKRGIKAFLEQNFDKPLKIEDYAYLTGRSISTFHRDFKRLYGLAPKQWLIEKRLKKARQIMESNQHLSVTQVALDIGYTNISHFIKAFQKQFGFSPKQFQMQLRKEILL